MFFWKNNDLTEETRKRSQKMYFFLIQNRGEEKWNWRRFDF